LRRSPLRRGRKEAREGPRRRRGERDGRGVERRSRQRDRKEADEARERDGGGAPAGCVRLSPASAKRAERGPRGEEKERDEGDPSLRACLKEVVLRRVHEAVGDRTA